LQGFVFATLRAKENRAKRRNPALPYVRQDASTPAGSSLSKVYQTFDCQSAPCRGHSKRKRRSFYRAWYFALHPKSLLFLYATYKGLTGVILGVHHQTMPRNVFLTFY
jgi:hypothetical protein